MFELVNFNHKHLNIPMMARYIIVFAKWYLKITEVIVVYKSQCFFMQPIYNIVGLSR